MKYDEREEKEIQRKEKLRRELMNKIYFEYDIKCIYTEALVGIILCIAATIFIYKVPKWPSYMLEMWQNLVSIFIVCVIPAWMLLVWAETFVLNIIFDSLRYKKYSETIAKMCPASRYEIEKKREKEREEEIRRKEEIKREKEKREEEKRRRAEDWERERRYREQRRSDPATINRCQNLLKLLECFQNDYYMTVDPTIRSCWSGIKFNMVRERNLANMYCDKLEEHLLNNYVDTLITRPMGYSWVMAHKR